MASVVFYFQVHQPNRLRRYTIFDSSHDYFDDVKNQQILRKVAEKCYLPMNQVILDLARRHNGNFRASYSLTGTILDQFQRWGGDVLDSFIELSKTGCIEFICETYYHSMAFLYSRNEFIARPRSISSLCRTSSDRRLRSSATPS